MLNVDESQVAELQIPDGFQPNLLKNSERVSLSKEGADLAKHPASNLSEAKQIKVSKLSPGEEAKRPEESRASDPSVEKVPDGLKLPLVEQSASKMSNTDTLSLNSCTSAQVRNLNSRSQLGGKALGLNIDSIHFRELTLEDVYYTLHPNSLVPQVVTTDEETQIQVDISSWHK